MKNTFVLHGVIDLAFDLLVRVCFLVLIINIVDSELVISNPQFCNTQFDDFQSIVLLVDGVNENIAGCGLLVCFQRK